MNNPVMDRPDFSAPIVSATSHSQIDSQDKSSILVVDDRTENILVLRSMLEELGQNIVAVHSGEEALKMLLKQEFAVILLDVNMPGMDGLETAGYIRQRRKTMHTPIIFLTAYIEEMHTAKGYSLGAVDYIMTPVMPEVLRTKVKVFVQLHQMQRQVEREAENRVALAHEQAARAAAEESRRRSAFLAEASHLLSSSLDVDTTAKSLARFVVPFLADLGGIALGQQDGETPFVAVSWVDPDDAHHCHDSVLDKIDDRVLVQAISEALSSGETRLVDDIEGTTTLIHDRRPAQEGYTPEPPLALRRIAVLPLLARGRTLGTLLLGMASPDRTFDTLTLELAGDLAGRVAISLDNCMLYARIQEQDQRKNEFLAMLAHELRNPLAPIRNAVQLLDAPHPDPARLSWATRVLERQSRQLVRLVDDLLDVARITQGQITLKSERVDVAAVLSMAVETCSTVIGDRHHELSVHPPARPLTLRGDAARIAQVLSNLLNNAAKYTDPGGRISISAQAADDDVVFTVRDNGVGIRPEMLAKIFDLFTQADRSLDRSQGGLGVGLTIVQRIVDLHGGTVRALSDGLGKGSEFIVRLPRAMEEPPPQAGASRELGPDGRRSILIVDDYVDSAETIATLLRGEGHTVHVCHDGPSALRMARELKPDAILLDIGLPGMSGFDVAKLLRAHEETQDCLIVALSGYGQSADYELSRRAGFDHHLVKPAELAMLREVLDSTRVDSKQRYGAG
ncbi:MAG: response regulator [Rhodospirillaceae bacterium]